MQHLLSKTAAADRRVDLLKRKLCGAKGPETLRKRSRSGGEKDEPSGVQIMQYHCPQSVYDSYDDLARDSRFMSADVMILTETDPDYEGAERDPILFPGFHCPIQLFKSRSPWGSMALYVNRRIDPLRSPNEARWHLNEEAGVYAASFELNGPRIAILHADWSGWNYYVATEAILHVLPPGEEGGGGEATTTHSNVVLFSNVGAEPESFREARLRRWFSSLYGLRLRTPLGREGTAVFSKRPPLECGEYRTDKDFGERAPIYVQTCPKQ